MDAMQLESVVTYNGITVQHVAADQFTYEVDRSTTTTAATTNEYFSLVPAICSSSVNLFPIPGLYIGHYSTVSCFFSIFTRDSCTGSYC